MRHALAVLFVLLAACGGSGGKDDTSKKPPVPVTVVELATVGTGDVADLLLASGTVEAEVSADLVPNTTGLVREVRADVGDAVVAGQVLAVLENVQLDAGAERARAQVAHLEAQVAELERLHASGAVSDRELADLRYELATARTGLREATRSAGETRITAPFSGLVAARDVKVGELATSAKRAFQVVDLKDLRVRADLPERDLARVRLGQRARLVAAYDESLVAEATVTRVAPVVDATTGTFQVTLSLDPGQKVLRPGQYVRVELEVDRHTGVVVVPKDAVRYEAGRPHVFVAVEAPPEEAASEGDAKADGAKAGDGAAPRPTGPALVARRVDVRLGLAEPARVEVLEGLSPGDRLVVVGQGNLRDGARIREPSTADAASDAPAEAEAPAAAPDAERG